MKRLNLTGKTFGRGRLTVLGFHHSDGHSSFWLCKCQCGKLVVVRGNSLTSGNTTSCNCSRRRDGVKAKPVRPPEYRSWDNMIQRCTNPNYPWFFRYGGRGITVCARWLSFVNFLADMGPRPGKGWSIERKNNDLGYSPQNCCWATASQQAINKRQRSTKGQ